MSPRSKPAAQLVADRLASYLGPHTAKNAVKTFSNRVLQRPPETLVYSDIEPLLRALRPMLRTLLGANEAENLIILVTKEAAA